MGIHHHLQGGPALEIASHAIGRGRLAGRGFAMVRLRVGVLGAGLIAQVEHVPNLLRLKEKFDLVRVGDPSAKARDFMADHYGIPVCNGLEALLGERLDALVVAGPDFMHAAAIARALEAGLHVFCEKPLCYSLDDADRLIGARDEAGKVVQVGYMKRFDPSVELLLHHLPRDGAGLRHISVVVNESDAAHQIAHHVTRPGGELGAKDRLKADEEIRRQIQAALGFDPSPLLAKGFAGPFCSSLIHDVNLVHLMLDRMGIADVRPLSASVFAEGEAGGASASLKQGSALWQMAHVMAPGLAEYRERISLIFADRVVDLTFPSPYLNHQATELVVHRSKGDHYERVVERRGFAEPYILELEAFWSACVEGTRARNTLEEARRDLALLAEFARTARNAGTP
jgi:predicted dehydrogenase